MLALPAISNSTNRNLLVHYSVYTLHYDGEVGIRTHARLPVAPMTYASPIICRNNHECLAYFRMAWKVRIEYEETDEPIQYEHSHYQT